MNPDQGITSLSQRGLNIFLSAAVTDIPAEICTFSEADQEKTLVVIGHGGKSLWEKLPALKSDHPIDNYSLQQMKWFAENVLENDIEILFPDDKKLIPLQKLGRFFNLAHPSPLGFDISDKFGLWFAYRGVFLTSKKLPTIKMPGNLSPCESCVTKPCLSETKIFDARMKCPVKTEHQYTTQQQNYHLGVIQGFDNRF